MNMPPDLRCIDLAAIWFGRKTLQLSFATLLLTSYLDRMTELTRILRAIERGETAAASQLLPLVYAELRQLAAQKLALEKPGQTFEATALVHEAYLRLVGKGDAEQWDSRGHFFAAAAEAMRRILIENARRKRRRKHGGGRQRIDLEEHVVADQSRPEDILAIDDAITKLAAEDADAAEVVKLRYYVGLSVEEAATALGISRASAYRHWTYARAWLRCALQEQDSANE
jgi:RNA polymerase sigma factor (TIGR02999 family)